MTIVTWQPGRQSLPLSTTAEPTLSKFWGFFGHKYLWQEWTSDWPDVWACWGMLPRNRYSPPGLAGNTWELVGVVYTSCLHLVSKAVVTASSSIRRSEARSQTGIKASVRMAKEAPNPGRILIPLGGIIHSFVSPGRPGGLCSHPSTCRGAGHPHCAWPPPSVGSHAPSAIKDASSLRMPLLRLSVTVPSGQLHIYLLHLKIPSNPLVSRK